MKGVTTDEIKEYLKSQGVLNVRRITIKKDGKIIETNTFVLTFNRPTIPKEIRIFYRLIKVELYIPKIVSEYDQEIPQSQTADNPVAPRGRAAQPSQDTRKTNYPYVALNARSLDIMRTDALLLQFVQNVAKKDTVVSDLKTVKGQ